MVLKHFKLASDLLGLGFSSDRGNGLEKLRGLPFWSTDNNIFNVTPLVNLLQDYIFAVSNELKANLSE